MTAEKSSGLRYAVIGAGMAGVLAGIKLKASGDDFTIFEKAASLGGTWRENRYPGLTCDVPAHAYTYSFEPYAEWKAYYAKGPEIEEYFVKTADKYGVTPHIRYNAEIVSCVWDNESAQWNLRTINGDTYIADVVIAASGVLHHPKMPDIPGLSTFEGKAFHSARWDDAAMIDGARVGVIGNGSTGVQIVTALAERSAKVVHFQRSPQWIMPVPYFEYSDAEREAFRKDPALIDEIRNNKDYWDNIHRFMKAITDTNGPEIAGVEEACRVNLETSIKDPVLREKLRPSYRAACKRLIYSWSYYDAVQKPNVFVDIGGIEQIEPKGVRMKDGTLHELDTLVLATGFHADRFIRPTSVLGAGGRSLDDAWKVRPTAYYAVTLPDFPNLFLLNGPTGPVGNFSLIDIAERQWGYIEKLLEPLREGTAKAVAPKQSALDAYEEKRIAAAKKTIFGSGCKSWYLDDTGVPASWPWSYDAFADAMNHPVTADYELA